MKVLSSKQIEKLKVKCNFLILKGQEVCQS